MDKLPKEEIWKQFVKKDVLEDLKKSAGKEMLYFAALSLKEIYDAFIQAGFTEDQSLKVIVMLMTQTPKQ